MRIPDGVLPPELANAPHVVTQKAGLSPWHCRLLVAIEEIADYYRAVRAEHATTPAGRAGAARVARAEAREAKDA